MGLIIAADVHSASVQDRDGALNLFTQAKYKAPTLRKFFADQGYIAKPLFIGDRIRLPRKLLMLQDYFDNLDHNLALQAIKKHTDCKWVILYVERWMKSPIQQADGSKVVREKRSSARRFNKPNHFKHIYAPCI